MYLHRLSLHHVRCFEQLQLTFSDGKRPRRWTMLVGANGTGKTTLLRAIAAALDRYPSSQSGAVAPDTTWLRNGAKNGGITFEVVFDHRNPRTGGFPLPPPPKPMVAVVGIDAPMHLDGDLVVALGASRLWPTSPEHTGLVTPPDEASPIRARRGSVASLFGSATTSIGPLFDWIKWEDYIRLKNQHESAHRPSVITSLANAFEKLFGGIAKYKEVDTRGAILFDTQDGAVPLDRLADGLRSVFVIVSELLLRLDKAFPDSPNPTQEEAVCIVDELDAHLHPTLQRTIVPALRGLFPKVQFIITTHSPFVVGSAQAGEIVVLRRSPSGAVEVQDENLPDVAGWTVDQIATSEIFGLDTTRDLRGETALRTERALLEKPPPLAAAEAAQLAEARNLLNVAEGPVTAKVRELLARKR